MKAKDQVQVNAVKKSKVIDHVKIGFVRKATQKPVVALKELKSSTAQMGENVHSTDVTRILNNASVSISWSRM